MCLKDLRGIYTALPTLGGHSHDSLSLSIALQSLHWKTWKSNSYLRLKGQMTNWIEQIEKTTITYILLHVEPARETSSQARPLVAEEIMSHGLFRHIG